MDAVSAFAELFQLQEMDKELDLIRDEQNRLPESLVAIRSARFALLEQLARLEELILDLQRRYREGDLEIADFTQKRDQAKSDQNRAESAREQTQYENRIQQLSARIDELTEQTLPLLDEIERLEAQVGEVKADLAELEIAWQLEETGNSQRIAVLQKQLSARVAERDELARVVPPAMLHEYETIRKAQKGIGIAQVLHSGSSFRCGACQVQLPVHVAQKAHHPEKIVHCPSCGRILWGGPI